MGTPRGIRFGVSVDGLTATRNALGDIDKASLRSMDRGIRAAIQPMAVRARTLTPRRTGASVRGVRIRRVRQRRNSSGWAIVQVARGGSIIEFAKQGRTPQGKALVATLNARYGARVGRALWRAYDERKGTVEPAIAAQMRAAETIIQRDLNRRAGR